MVRSSRHSDAWFHSGLQLGAWMQAGVEPRLEEAGASAWAVVEAQFWASVLRSARGVDDE